MQQFSLRCKIYGIAIEKLDSLQSKIYIQIKLRLKFSRNLYINLNKRIKNILHTSVCIDVHVDVVVKKSRDIFTYLNKGVLTTYSFGNQKTMEAGP